MNKWQQLMFINGVVNGTLQEIISNFSEDEFDADDVIDTLKSKLVEANDTLIEIEDNTPEPE